ncbi:MAG: glycosyltransferase, partial [Candidatus Competibacteraceae bacterium]|nr:glycosyltransferase [Candidatus Competibacteraceae bacterium]
MEFPEVLFILPVFNRLDLTRDFVARLPATLPAGLRWEAVIIDDASTDGTAEFLATLAAPFASCVRKKRRLRPRRQLRCRSRVAHGHGLRPAQHDLLLAPGCS